MLTREAIALVLSGLILTLVASTPVPGEPVLQAQVSGTVGTGVPEPMPIPTTVYVVRPWVQDCLDEEIGSHAIRYTWLTRAVYCGSPEVLLVRRVMASELPLLGLMDVGTPDGDPPLALVVVGGYFNLRNRVDEVGFIGYVMNLRDGGVMGWQESYDGSRFGRVLTPGSVPWDPPPVNTPGPRRTMPPVPELLPEHRVPLPDTTVGRLEDLTATIVARTPTAVTTLVVQRTAIPGASLPSQHASDTDRGS
jgi:hypothetical protein